DSGDIVACDTPTNLLASIAGEVLELRVDQPEQAAAALRDSGVDADDVVVIGSTVTASLHTLSAAQALQLLDRQSIPVRSTTVRRATLDDVYLRLTGGRMTSTPD